MHEQARTLDYSCEGAQGDPEGGHNAWQTIANMTAIAEASRRRSSSEQAKGIAGIALAPGPGAQGLHRATQDATSDISCASLKHRNVVRRMARQRGGTAENCSNEFQTPPLRFSSQHC